MTYIYEMCPHCMSQLIERKQPIEDCDSVNFCPQCGKKMEMACFGEQKIDNTIYKIILNDASISDYMDKKNKFLSTLMELGNISFNEALKKYGTKDCVIFEGDISSTYVSMGLLDGFTPSIKYTVVPPFPFERLVNPHICICPVCGSDTIHKTEDVDIPPNYVMDGFFCEKCNTWVMSATMPKSEMDETLYHLKISLKEVEDKVKQEIMGTVNQLHDKEVANDEIIVRDLAKNIEILLRIVETYDIAYEITPPYPHEIVVLKQEWTEDDIKQLIAANPGLAVSAEEMNSLNGVIQYDA